MARSFNPAASQWLSAAGLPAMAAPLTVSCWFKPGATSVGSQTLIALDDGAVAANHLALRQLNTSGQAQVQQVEGGTTLFGNLASPIGTDGVWEPWGMVLASATSRKVWFAGVSAAGSSNSLTSTGLVEVHLGALRGTSQFLNGSLAEVGVWSVALSDDEMTMLAAGICPLLVRPASLVAYWSLQGDDPEIDPIGGYDLTLHNAPAVTAHPPIIYATTVIVTIGGIDHSADIRFATLQISDQLNDAPNECSFTTMNGYEPAEHSELIITLGATRIFAGTIVSVEQTMESLEGNLFWHVSALDYTYLLARRHPMYRYVSTSLSSIVPDLVSRFANGFTTAAVEAAMTSVSIDFDGREDLPKCLTRVTQLGGAYWKPTYAKDVAAFTADVVDAPDDIDDTHTTIKQDMLRRAADARQVTNRINVEGDGSTAAAAVAVGSTTLPIGDQTPFFAAGGSTRIGPQVLTYTGKSADAADGTTREKASQTDGVHQSPSACTAAVAAAFSISSLSRSGGTVTATAGAAHKLTTGQRVVIAGASPVAYNGVVSVTVTGSTTFTYPIGSAPGAASGTITAIAVGSVNVGAHLYRVAFIGLNGQSELSATVSATVVAVTLPGAPTTAAVSGVSGNLTVGSYLYKVSYLTASGETLPGTVSAAVVIAHVAAPSAATLTGATVTGGGLVAGSNYDYQVTYVTTAGETTAGTNVTSNPGGSNNAFNLTNIPTSADGRVLRRRLWRTIAGGSGGSAHFLLAELSDNTGTTYTDVTPDLQLGAENPPTANTSGSGQAALTSIPVSGDARVIMRRIYRTVVDGAEFILCGTIPNNTGTTLTDNVADDSLTSPVPSAGTADVSAVLLTSIPTGPAGTTARRLFSTFAGGSVDHAYATIGDNTTTVFYVTGGDDALGQEAGANAAGIALGSTVKTLTGATALAVVDLAKFTETLGWVKAGSQLI